MFARQVVHGAEPSEWDPSDEDLMTIFASNLFNYFEDEFDYLLDSEELDKILRGSRRRT